MLGTHDDIEETNVSAAMHSIKSLVFTSQKASFATHMASSNVSPAACNLRSSASRNYVNQVERPRAPYLNPIQLATHALGARHALPQRHALASKDRDVDTVIPLVVLLSSRKARGRPAYTSALSDARTLACPIPDRSSTNLTPTCPTSSSPIRNTGLNSHSPTTLVFSSKQRFPERVKFWQRWEHSYAPTSCFCSLESCVCVTAIPKIPRHSPEGSQRTWTKNQYPYASSASVVSSSPSLSPSTSINADALMTPSVKTPVFTYLDLRTDTIHSKEDRGGRQEETCKQPDPGSAVESLRVPCFCESQSLDALGMPFNSLHPCTECTRRDSKSMLPLRMVMQPHMNTDPTPHIISASLYGHSMVI